MDSQSLSDKLAAVAVALLLILTAWGNALVMLVVALLVNNIPKDRRYPEFWL